MATGKRFYWIKLKESFFDDDGPVDFMMAQPGGANYVVLYQMLCLKTINTEGKLSNQIGEVMIQYDIKKIQRICKYFSEDTVRVALNLYKSLGLIYEEANGTLVMANHHAMVGSETDWAAKKQRQRSGESALPPGDTSGDTDRDNVPIENRDKEIKILENIENRDKENTTLSADANETASREECPFSKIKALYHEICISFPKIISIDGNRRKAVAARWRAKKSLDVFRDLFRIAESSSFLKGQNSRNWSADFDWMMNPTNFSKILEHKYDDKGQPGSSGVLGALAQMYEEASND